MALTTRKGLKQKTPLKAKTPLRAKPKVYSPEDIQKAYEKKKESFQRKKEKDALKVPSKSKTPKVKKVSKRLTDEKHLKFLRTLPCMICGSIMVEAHHLLRTPERGASRKSDDNHVIPLCVTHHSQLHMNGNETEFLKENGFEGQLVLSEDLYENTGNPGICEDIIESYRIKK